MSVPAALAPPLLGLFEALLARGARLSVRDYLDALRALEAGWGHGDRAALRRLAQTLWARSDEERRLVARWFDAIPAPPAALLDPVERRLAARERRRANRGAAPQAAGTATGVVPSSAHPRGTAGADRAAADSGVRARVAIGSATDGGALSLPRVLAEPAIEDEYVLHPRALIGLRELGVLWRRFRRATRSGARVELDLDATVQERCRRGVLRTPVLRARRRNAARLLVLADASPSMAPWLPFLETLQASLAIGRLGDCALRWFANVPRAQLHRSASLDAPEPCDELLRRFDGAGLLIVSDGGSARALLSPRRAAQTARFLDQASAGCPRIVWLNPMPLSRWAGSTAALLEADARLTMLPLDAPNLLRAVDILRGHK